MSPYFHIAAVVLCALAFRTLYPKFYAKLFQHGLKRPKSKGASTTSNIYDAWKIRAWDHPVIQAFGRPLDATLCDGAHVDGLEVVVKNEGDDQKQLRFLFQGTYFYRVFDERFRHGVSAVWPEDLPAGTWTLILEDSDFLQELRGDSFFETEGSKCKFTHYVIWTGWAVVEVIAQKEPEINSYKAGSLASS